MHVPQEIVLELMVEDVGRSMGFYREVLGFQLLAQEAAEGKTYWAKLELNGFLISFKSREKAAEESPFLLAGPPGGSLSICLQVPDIREAYAEVERQCELLDFPHLTPCGSTQFSLKDPDGYVLTFEAPLSFP